MDLSQALASRLLNLARHQNISAVLQLAERIETEAPELGIGIEHEGEASYLRYGENRVEICREVASQRVRFTGDLGTKPRRIVVPIPVDLLQEIAHYLESKVGHGEEAELSSGPRRPR
jgi:hypothetical protein